MLETNQIACEVVEVDLLSGDEQKQALAEVEKLTGKRGFPVTVIGTRVIEGFKQEEIERGLESDA